jgi:hypothetical protein
MIDLKIQSRGFDVLQEAFKQAPLLTEAGLPNLAMQAGQDTIDYARYLFRLPKSGKTRMSKDGSGRMMVGSAPGEAPAVDTGKLDTSMNAVVRNFTVTINKELPTEYAEELEATRPFMEPAMNHAGERYYASVLNLIQRVL